MKTLPNNCRAGKMGVFPKNWKTAKADPNLKWYISYRFYDDNLNQKKLVIIKGMNEYSDLKQKQDAVRILIEEELDQLEHKGYNPITKTYSISQHEIEISEYTPFLQALNYAKDKMKVSPATMIDINSCLKYFSEAAKQLKYDLMPIGQIRRRHLKHLLDRTGKIKLSTPVVISTKTGKTKLGTWTANTFNQYKAHLSMLFGELLEYDAVETNWVRDIKKQKSEKRIRETLTMDERKKVNDLLFKKDVNFWRFLHIFFHSGSRETELLNVRVKDVDLENQRFKVMMKKGKNYQEEWRIIKDVSLNLWLEILSMASGNQFLFSKGLLPGDCPIRREQITRRWRRHVKKPLGITADFYSLKHSNLDEVADQMSLKDAQELAGHKTPVITLTYAIGEQKRKHERIKKVNNKFA